MSLQLFGHPFSSYCQKALIALYENATPFEMRLLTPEDPETGAEHARLWPVKRMPVLVDAGRTVVEASVIIEYLDLHYPGALRMVPEDPAIALEVRMLDRIFDHYLMTPVQKIVFDCIRAVEHRDPYGVNEARLLLDTTYRWLNQRLQDREWVVGEQFSLADCAAAPSLFYADWVQPIDHSLMALREYRRRLLARPSVARAVDEARPYRAYFPPGAPARD